MTLILPSCYLAPIPHYAAMLQQGGARIEQYDNYVKQTFRNRCIITGPNGPQTLTIPVEKPSTHKCLMRDLRISEHGNWRHLHWNALESSYGKSPFFEYYADDLRPFYTERRYPFLCEFNLQLTHTLLQLLDIEAEIELTDHYMQTDLQQWAEPSMLRELPYPTYYQVFAQRNGFQSHLSILDLLFNMGPESVLVLMSNNYDCEA